MSQWRPKLPASWNVYRSCPTRRLFCDGELPVEIADALWGDPDEHLLGKADVLQVKDRCLVARYTDRHGVFLCKRSNWGTVWRTSRMLLRKPVALQCAAAGAFLKDHGIPTPRPRACMVQGIGPFRYRSYLLNDFVGGASLFHRIRAGDLPINQVRPLARQLAKIWEKLISLRISHNDFKPENVIVDEALRLWLIDLEKIRVHRHDEALRMRHLRDVERFLHVRSWRDQTAAAEIFRQELQQTTLGRWIRPAEAQNHPLCRSGYPVNDLGNRISVGIIAHPFKTTEDDIQKTVESVKDLADEIALIEETSRNGELLVLRRMVGRGHGEATGTKCHAAAESSTLQHPWVMVLQAGECATPDLVRQLPERLVGETSGEVASIPVEECIGGRSTGRVPVAEVRVVNRDRTRYALRRGGMFCETAPKNLFKLKVGIKQHVACSIEEYRNFLRQRRGRAGEGQESRSRFRLRSMVRVVLCFGQRYLVEGRFRGGKLGLRVALAEAGCVWRYEFELQRASQQTQYGCRKGADESSPTDSAGQPIARASRPTRGAA